MILKFKQFYIKIKNSYLFKKYNLNLTNKIFTHLTIEEKLKLYNLSLEKSGIFTEIGSYLGASSCVIAQAIKNSKKNTKLYCIDTWNNDAMSEGNKNTYQEFLNNTKNYSNIITPIRKKSIEAAKDFNEKVDFLFIDGDHSYKGVKEDVDNWLPKLNKNAVIVFHDFGWAEGVKKVIEEEIEPIISRKEILPNMWCGWLK